MDEGGNYFLSRVKGQVISRLDNFTIGQFIAKGQEARVKSREARAYLISQLDDFTIYDFSKPLDLGAVYCIRGAFFC